MPQSLNQKVTNTFIKGLITEAGELTFPADASVDELNCLLERDGSRKRREGIAFEPNFENSSFLVKDGDIVSTGTWTNVAGFPEKEFLVVQVNSHIYFYDKADAPYSSTQIKNFSWTSTDGNFLSQTGQEYINMRSFDYKNNGDFNDHKCDFTSISGILVIAHPETETTAIIAKLDNSTGSDVWSFKVEPIRFRTRDFKYLSKRSDLLDPVDELEVSAQRIYDTSNSGWFGVGNGSAALKTYRTDEGQFPALNLSWFAGINAAGAFTTAEWKQIQAGSSLIGNGLNIVDFFNRYRKPLDNVPLIADGSVRRLPPELANEKIFDRFSTVATLSGRVFYSGLNKGGHDDSNVVLFSAVTEGASASVSADASSLGECLQKNDPTSQDFSDLLDDDGGVIRIAEAYGIRKLHPFNNSIFVFAENGVWQIKGVDDVFRATGFAVNKISSVGLFNRDTFVSADGVPFWWSDVGIHTLGFDGQTFQASENNISLNTIQTFFDKIKSDQARRCVSVFDPVNKRIYWMYPNESEPVLSKLNNFLILDIPLQAFYPWKIEDTDSNTPEIIGAEYYTGFSSEVTTYNIVDNDEDTVVTNSGNLVVNYSQRFVDTGEPALVFLCRGGSSQFVTMGFFYDTDFKDWGEASYLSFAEAGHEFMGDLMLRKNAPYIQVYSRVTETGWEGNETSGYDPIREGSLLVSSFWDFSKTNTQQQQAYRLKPMPIVNPSDLTDFGYPDTVVDTRLKIRGRGKSMRLRFESEEGKDFHLLGYGVLSATNRRF